MSNAVGMMNEAYFVSRTELISWINNLLKLNVTKVEECASAVVHLLIMDSLHPGKVKLKKVNFAAKHDYEFVNNFKLLQEVFRSVGLSKVIPVDRLIKARYQDNLEFLQFMHHYFQEHKEQAASYDALGRRKQAAVKNFPLSIKTGAARRKPSGSSLPSLAKQKAAPVKDSTADSTRPPHSRESSSASTPTASDAGSTVSSTVSSTTISDGMRSRFGWKPKTAPFVSEVEVDPPFAGETETPSAQESTPTDSKSASGDANGNFEEEDDDDFFSEEAQIRRKEADVETDEDFISKLMVDRDFYFSKLCALEDLCLERPDDDVANAVLKCLNAIPEVDISAAQQVTRPSIKAGSSSFSVASMPLPASSSARDSIGALTRPRLASTLDSSTAKPSVPEPEPDIWSLGEIALPTMPTLQSVPALRQEDSASVQASFEKAAFSVPKSTVHVDIDDEISFVTEQKRQPLRQLSTNQQRPTPQKPNFFTGKKPQTVLVEIDDEVTFNQ